MTETSLLKQEIYEQPQAIQQFLAREIENVSAIAGDISRQSFDYILIAARGTSDNAARYGQYLFGMRNRLPVALAAPSLFTIYNTPPRLERVLVIGISQSGQSPDVVSVIEESRRQNAPCIAITNDPASPLAQVAGHHIYLGVGQEFSVAATKTYTAELAALALLSVLLQGDTTGLEQLRSIPTVMDWALKGELQAQAAAKAIANFNRAVVIGRGINYATAYETALKIKELSYVEAEPYSSADFRHGPIAMADPGLPVVLISAGETFRAELADLRTDLSQQGARLAVIADEKHFNKNELPISLPENLPEWLTPLVAILPGQLLAYHLAQARGHDPDQPRTIHKVTLTF